METVERRYLEPGIGADVLHGPEPWAKLERTEDGLIIERKPPDAQEMVEAGLGTLVPADTPSIVDHLLGLLDSELRALLVDAGVNAHHLETRGGLLKRCLPLVEDGTIDLSGEE